jgi:dihydrofolate reductase
MKVSLIVAVSENGVIGRDGGLPWRQSADLKRFKNLTKGHTIIMGRRTWESIGRPLPDRRTIVVSRQPDYRPEADVRVAASLDAAIESAAGEDEVFVIGGGQLYSEALPRVDRLYLTRVSAHVEGDTKFPDVDWSVWKLTAMEDCAADDKNEYACQFQVYQRVERK